jgi:quercetin dioxygenase-like cupin family protein
MASHFTPLKSRGPARNVGLVESSTREPVRRGGHNGAAAPGSSNQPGQGPRLHRHPYDETFLILDGRLRVTVGEETIVGGPGDIIIGPAEAPHGFTNLGPGPARLVCIHAAPATTTQWLD